MTTIVSAPRAYHYTNIPALYNIFSTQRGTISFVLALRSANSYTYISLSAMFIHSYTLDGTIGYISSIDISPYIRAYASLPCISSTTLISQINLDTSDTLHFSLYQGFDALNKSDIGDSWHAAMMGQITPPVLDAKINSLYNYTNPLLSPRAVSAITNIYFDEARNASFAMFLPSTDLSIRTTNSTETIPISPGENNTAISILNLSAVNISALHSINLDLIADNIVLATITVLPNPVAEQYTLLSFRNSFGFLENILLFGSITRNISIEREILSQYNPDTGTYNTISRRKPTTDSYIIASGYIEPHRIPLFLDLLLSDEVYINRAGLLTPCTISTVEFSYETLLSSPWGIEIEINTSAPLLIPDKTEQIPTLFSTEDEITLITEDNFPLSI